MPAVLRKYYQLLMPIALGLVALTVPLLRDFHLESALLAAFAGCLWAGWKAAERASENSDLRQALLILMYLYLFGLPLLFFALFTGCFSVHGLGFWLLYPVPSVFFGCAVGRLFRIWKVSFGRHLAVLLLLVIAFGGLLVEFFSFPQVYFFNHVWGGWPGPIYDETVQVTGSLLYFRAITVFWILLLWFIPDFRSNKEATWIVLLSITALLFSYTWLSETGIISPRSYIQKQLGGKEQTEHFTLYFAENYYSMHEIDRLALEHEFYLDQITKQLQLSKPDSNEKIESYLYAHPWQKKKLVGAKFTSYVPVWLGQDQIHIAKQQLGGSLKHELAHVMAKQFGNELFNASWSIGLIEGLAVAVAPNESKTSTIDQIVVSEKPLPDATEMNHALSPLGFYGGRSAVNYTTSGSFVRYLLASYPVENFKEAYQSGSIKKAYPVRIEELVQDWHQHLDTVSVDSVDKKIAKRLFSIPSLFEKACPHILTDFASSWDDYRFHMAEGDTSLAVEKLERALDEKPEIQPVKAEWAFMSLKEARPRKVQKKANRQDTLVDLQLLYADAFALNDQWKEADLHVDIAKRQLADNPDSTYDAAISTRIDSLQWKYYLDLSYGNKLFGEEAFKELLYRTKLRTIEKAIKEEQWNKLKIYAQIIYELPGDAQYFDTYLSMVHMLGYLQEWDLADRWLNKLAAMEMRQRYKERLQQESRWIAYLKSKANNIYE